MRSSTTHAGSVRRRTVETEELLEAKQRIAVIDPTARGEERIAPIAREYARAPESTLVVSPDNSSRAEINARIHAELQARGAVGAEEHRTRVLVPRQDLTGADRMWAARYAPGDVLLYSRDSKETGIRKGEYARVVGVDAAANRLTVERRDAAGHIRRKRMTRAGSRVYRSVALRSGPSPLATGCS